MGVLQAAGKRAGRILCLGACLWAIWSLPRLEAQDGAHPGVSAWDLLDRGKQLLFAGRSQEALAAFQDFVAGKPEEPEGSFWQGVALDELGRTPEALEAYRRSVRLVPAGMDSAELHVNLGNALVKLGRAGEAIPHYRRALVIDPRQSLACLNLGRAMLASGQPAEALECFQHCAELGFDGNQLPYYRARAYVGMGKVQEARAQVQLLLEKLTGFERERLQAEFQDLLPQGPPAMP